MKEAMKKYQEIRPKDRFLTKLDATIFSLSLNGDLKLPTSRVIEIFSVEDNGYFIASMLEESEFIINRYFINKRFGYVSIHYNEFQEEVKASTDDLAIYDFATEMLNKLVKKAETGKSGWDNPSRCSHEYLAELFATEIHKCAIGAGDLVDVANYCMMLRHRNVDMEIIMDKLTGMVNIRESKLLKAAKDIVHIWNTKNVDGLKEAIKLYQK